MFLKSLLIVLKILQTIDPCHCFSSPGLGWDGILKMTGVELKKIQTLACTYSSKMD